MTPAINEDLYQAGYEDGWAAYEMAQPAGQPIGVEEDYDLGWWCGVGHADAWHEGFHAAEAGVYVCPYVLVDDESYRFCWLEGYACAMEFGEVRHAA